MKSNHLPKNTTIFLPPGSAAERAEIFWQTMNCEHFMENYRVDLTRTNPKEKVHNLKFADVARMLSGNVIISPVPNSTRKYQAIAWWNGKYYLTIFTLEHRPENYSTLFAVIITTYTTYESRHITTYKQYIEAIRQKYGH